MVKGSDLLVSALENEGIDHIFGVPGEEVLHIWESIRKSEIKLVTTLNEWSAVLMAATHGRLTGRPGACIATCGPGALNFPNGAAYALLGGWPVVMITGQKSIKSTPQARFQIIDVLNVMKPVTKLATQIRSSGMIPTEVRDAFRVAMEEKPGPVLLEVPEDIAAEECPEVELIAPHSFEAPTASAKALDWAAALIAEAERPILMFGAAASRPRSTTVLEWSVFRMGIPFFTTQMGKGAVAESSNLYIGTAALSENDDVHEAVDKADLIVTIGHDTCEKPPFIMTKDGPKVIHIGYQPATVEEVYFPQYEVIGDIGASLEALADRLEGKLPNAGALLPLRDGILTRISDRADEERWPVTPPWVVRAVNKVMKDGIAALDNGQYKIDFARSYRTNFPNALLLDNMLATMGAGLPSGISTALLYPECRVIVVCGDGGFQMTSQELATAVALKLNLVVLILEDGRWGMIAKKQAAAKLPAFGTEIPNPEFVKLAEAYGAKGTRVETPDDLVPALEAAFQGRGVHVVSVRINYS
ncbi:acetolactate synthase large subunit [Sinorhizobium meliloti]|nr:acetolactate synthase large subunit [Sinorhizobium meliloti]WQP09235.1 acetolactate synthase large subunit [Sinorhizobium meliloti]WQP22527.1 acetolactate synthase large subunit [Sinorhizobium meliloti]WQP22540.1 acetolactate synthase large subunit [Sinorhizobium meliloti]WQP35876.1 acetolactate synthase large subunit [Sinorhizobium meliloti]